MNRRSFMKRVSGAVAGVFALSLPSKAKPSLSGYPSECSAGIDPNSEWAKQTLNQMERLRIKAAEKVANPPYVIEWGTNKIYYLDEKVRS